MSEETDIVRADPGLRRAVIIVVLVAFASVVLLYGLLGDPFEWLYDRLVGDVGALAAQDPELARERAARIVIWTVASIWVFYVLVAGYGVWLGVRMWRAEQWPLPGARLIADTKVQRGRELRARAAAVIAVPLVLLLPISYYALKVGLWAAAGG